MMTQGQRPYFVRNRFESLRQQPLEQESIPDMMHFLSRLVLAAVLTGILATSAPTHAQGLSLGPICLPESPADSLFTIVQHRALERLSPVRDYAIYTNLGTFFHRVDRGAEDIEAVRIHFAPADDFAALMGASLFPDVLAKFLFDPETQAESTPSADELPEPTLERLTDEWGAPFYRISGTWPDETGRLADVVLHVDPVHHVLTHFHVRGMTELRDTMTPFEIAMHFSDFRVAGPLMLPYRITSSIPNASTVLGEEAMELISEALSTIDQRLATLVNQDAAIEGVRNLWSYRALDSIINRDVVLIEAEVHRIDVNAGLPDDLDWSN
jgi:hypothetical protein